MPLVTLTVRQDAPAAIRAGVLDAVHAALVASSVPATDVFQRVLALAPADFRFDPRYPDLDSDRPPTFVLVEVRWSVGRSVQVKRALLRRLMASVAVGGGGGRAPGGVGGDKRAGGGGGGRRPPAARLSVPEIITPPWAAGAGGRRP